MWGGRFMRGKKKILKEGYTYVAGSELVGGKVDRYVSGLSNHLTLEDFFIIFEKINR